MDAFIFWIMAGAFIALFYGPWQSIMVDLSRQKTFEARDAIFDLAASGRIAFSDPYYGFVRRRLQVTIRFAHQFTWIRLVTYYLLVPVGRREDLQKEHTAIVTKADASTQKEIDYHLEQVAKAMFQLFISRSLVMLLVVLPTILLIHFLGISTIQIGEWLLRRSEEDAEASVGDWDEAAGPRHGTAATS